MLNAYKHRFSHGDYPRAVVLAEQKRARRRERNKRHVWAGGYGPYFNVCQSCYHLGGFASCLVCGGVLC